VNIPPGYQLAKKPDPWLDAMSYYDCAFGLFWALQHGQTYLFILSFVVLVKMWHDD
jgi:hypothetical protein